jgi:type IV pilus assembly protein PilA
LPTTIREDDDGFTLIELLVVILIIGILAAIALPSFLGQRQKAQDTDAKSNARQLMTQVESCYTTTQDYTKCQAADLIDTGLPIGIAQGQATVASSAPDVYVVTAKSKSGGTFTITHSGSTPNVRGCSGGSKGCNGGSW